MLDADAAAVQRLYGQLVQLEELAGAYEPDAHAKQLAAPMADHEPAAQLMQDPAPTGDQ
jgi:hypothetical protein